MSTTYRFIAVLLFLMSSAILSDVGAQVRDSKGTDFWIAFPGNIASTGNEHFQQLLITSETAATGTVDIPGIGFSTGFTVNAYSSATVQFPVLVDVQSSDVVTNLGIHVTSDNDVTVYGLNKSEASSDGFLSLPVDILGKEYQVLGYSNVGEVMGNQFLIVAVEDTTTVTITPAVTVGPRIAGIPYTIEMWKGQTYLLRDLNGLPSDLSGSRISSDKPIGVFNGHLSANIPRGYVKFDHLVEMAPPMNSYGRSFVVAPLATRIGGDYWRIMASEDNTSLSINGVAHPPLSANQFTEVLLTGPAYITTGKPVLVSQYSTSSTFDNATGDPFMMYVPPYEQHCSSYVVRNPLTGFSVNFLNITAPNSVVGSLTINGNPVPAVDFSPVPGSDYSVASIPVSVGEYVLNADMPFGCLVYGFNSFEGYGYSGGQSSWRLADVVEITSGPEQSNGTLETVHCVQSRAIDGNGNPLAGIRVDFEQRGANPGRGSSTTNDSGYATHCYRGVNPGIDTILCRYYEFVDTLFMFWDNPLPVELVSFASSVSGRDVKLVWTTASELNNAGFDIERKSGNEAWTKTGFVQGSGTVFENRNYEFTDRNLHSGSYMYRLRQADYNGSFEYFDLQNQVTIGLPEKFELQQNYPNPFNPSTKIGFALPGDGNVTLKIYDNNGRLVETVISSYMAAGYYSKEFNASSLASGIYYYSLEFKGHNFSQMKVLKMTLIK